MTTTRPRKATGIPTALERAIEFIEARPHLGIRVSRSNDSSKWLVEIPSHAAATAVKPNRRSCLAHVADMIHWARKEVWEDFRTYVNWHGEPPTTWSPTTKSYVEAGPYWEARALYRLSLKEV